MNIANAWLHSHTAQMKVCAGGYNKDVPNRTTHSGKRVQRLQTRCWLSALTANAAGTVISSADLSAQLLQATGKLQVDHHPHCSKSSRSSTKLTQLN
jgi:hypothetical protein